MKTHSVPEAKNRLSELSIMSSSARAWWIIRHGHPVAELKAIREPPRLQASDLDWLVARRVGRALTDNDAGKRLSRIRDQDER